MAGAAIGGGVAQSHALQGSAVVAGEFLALHAHEEFRMTVLLAQPLGPQGQFLAETLALAGLLRHDGQSLGTAEAEVNAIGVVLREDSHLEEFHRRRQGHTERDRVHAVLVHHVVGEGEGIEIVHTDDRAEGIGRLVLQTTRGMPVLRPVDDGEVLRIDMSDPAAGDSAPETGLVGDEIGVAIGIRRGRCRGVDLVDAFELDLAEVPGGQSAPLLHHVDHRMGTTLGEFLASTAGSELGMGVLHHFHELRRIVHRDAPGAIGRHRLEVLRSHDGADATAAGSTVKIVDDTGVENTVLPRLADRGDLELGILVTGLDPLLGMPDAGSPDLVRRQDLDGIVIDVEIDRLVGPPLDEQQIVAGILEEGAELAARVGVSNGAGERTLAEHRIAATCRGHGSVERSSGEDENIVRPHRIALGVHVFVKVFRSKSALADIGVGPFHVQWFGFSGSLGEIDTQDLALPGHRRFSPELSSGLGRLVGVHVSGPSPHAIKTGPGRIHIDDRVGGTCLGTLGIAVAQVALDDLACVGIVVHRPEGAGNRAHLAPHADIILDLDRSRRRIADQRFHRTGMHAPCLRALCAGIGNGALAVFEFKDLDPGAGRIERAFMLERTGHFALQATRALVRINQKRFLHTPAPLLSRAFAAHNVAEAGRAAASLASVDHTRHVVCRWVVRNPSLRVTSPSGPACLEKGPEAFPRLGMGETGAVALFLVRKGRLERLMEGS